MVAARDFLVFDRIRVGFVPTDYILADPMTKIHEGIKLVAIGNNEQPRDDLTSRQKYSVIQRDDRSRNTNPVLELSKRLPNIQNQYNVHLTRIVSTRRIRKPIRTNQSAPGPSTV